MVILIGGPSHTGKTLLAQKLMEKYKTPYLSIDHIKMGIYRGYPDCGFTPESDEETITQKLWPVVSGIIKTAVENNQGLIIEGVYLPYNLYGLDENYSEKILYCKLLFSGEYIRNYFRTKIVENENAIEQRKERFDTPQEQYIKENARVRDLCEKNNVKYFEIKQDYTKEIKNVYMWIKKEYKKL
ncbi:adenylate kinase [Breznakiella homolactica]|uniref:Adenylate kinase n=1 Tax=Breznakiella homolactica TaxID=2798577 RepID=A0A7T7XK02_9SPIR|nr:adenylate kinase [Breznakiella homolactica]QQO07643.1 adenylate kinase [Breznakiella homolactica]